MAASHEIPFITHELADGVNIQIPPRINFLLKHDNKESRKPLYGVKDVIDILTYNGMDEQIGEFFFILGKQAAYIKQKLENRTLFTVGIINRMAGTAADRERLKRVIKERGPYEINTVSIEDLISYRLRRTILVKLIPTVKEIMTFITEKQQEIRTFTKDDYEKVLRIKQDIEGMLDSFYSNIIFQLPKDEQDEYLCTCFRDTYEDENGGIDFYIEEIVIGLMARYYEYYNSHRIMMVDSIRMAPRARGEAPSRIGTPYLKTLKEGTVLYRGYQKPTDPTKRRHLIQPGRPFVYFTPNPFVALGYAIPKGDGSDSDLGEISVYQTSKPLKLLDFSNYRTLDYIHALLNELGAPREVIESLLKGWFGWDGFGEDFKGPSPRSREKTFERDSDERTYFIVVEWICSKGFNGYVALNVDRFIDEIVLCEPVPLDETKSKKISHIGVLGKSVINYPLPSSKGEWYENILK